jgi:sialate O-acetylesterase
MKRATCYIFIAVPLFSFFFASANIRLPQLVGDHMVLQRDRNIKIWGWASPGEKISLSFNGREEHTITKPDQSWMIILPAMKAGGPFSMSITGKNKIELNDI